MLTGDPLSEETLLNLVARDAARLSMKNIRKVLVSLDQYSLDELEDPYDLGVLSKYDLVVRAIREGGSWELLPAFHEEREFSDETLEALEAEGIDLDGSEEDDEADTISEVDLQFEESLWQKTLRSISETVNLRIISKRIAAFRKKYREPMWVLSGIGTSLGILYVAVRLAMLWTGSENLPELLGFAIETPTPTMSLTPTTTETRLPTNQPTSTDLPTATLTLTPSPTQIASPAPAQSEQDGPRIAISEIMFVPQPPHGDKDLESWNEYVELFNYGEEPVDVSGWWISDGGVSGTPDKIVSWNERLTGIPVGKAITDSTIIPAGGYALILSTKYDDGDKSYSELIPEKTIILSLADHPDTKSELIGKNGLSASGEFLDVLVLYIGTEIRIETEVSTYGTPIYDEATGPESIRDDGLDAIPRAITTGWGGYQRVYLNAVDTPSNWARFTWDEKTPGYPALDDQTETE